MLHVTMLTSTVVAELASRADREDLMLLYNLPAFAEGNPNAFLSGVARSNGLIKKVMIFFAIVYTSVLTVAWPGRSAGFGGRLSYCPARLEHREVSPVYHASFPSLPFDNSLRSFPCRCLCQGRANFIQSSYPERDAQGRWRSQTQAW